MRRTLHASDQSIGGDAINQLESSVKSYLMTTCDNFPLDDVEKTVVNQVSLGRERARIKKYNKKRSSSINFRFIPRCMTTHASSNFWMCS